MKKIGILIFFIFSYYYANKIIEYSSNNNKIISSIDEYANEVDVSCIEGSINNDGVILSYSGLIVDKNKSYINMKGNTFNKDLIEYKKDNCILNLENNYDKYIISGNKELNNISIILDIVNNKYIDEMKQILDTNNIKYNISSFNIVDTNNYFLYKGNDIDTIKKLNNVYCTNIKYDILNDCYKNRINSINSINYIDNNLLTNIKKVINNGSIIFIKETQSNKNELLTSINYIKSRNYNIVYINELLTK